jgi:hypothetical protein
LAELGQRGGEEGEEEDRQHRVHLIRKAGRTMHHGKNEGARPDTLEEECFCSRWRRF